MHTVEGDAPNILQAWEAFRLPGQPTTVDGASLPYGGAHRLTTSVLNDGPDPSLRAHFSTGFPAMLDDAGEPALLPAWCYLFGP